MPSGQYFRIKLIRSAGSVVIVQSDSRKTSRGKTVPVEPEEGGIFAESSRLTEILFQLRDSKSAGRRSKGGGGGRKRSGEAFLHRFLFPLDAFTRLGRETLIPTPAVLRGRGGFSFPITNVIVITPQPRRGSPPRLPSREGGVSRPGAVSKAVCTLAGGINDTEI